MQATSIYHSPALTPIAPKSQAQRRAKDARSRARRGRAVAGRPTLQLDRLTPVTEMLRSYAHSGSEATESTPLEQWLIVLRAEVEALEIWAESRSESARMEGEAIRQTLEFLRGFGRLTALDFSTVPVEERDALVTMLALEHRWCYAAGGTTREAFKLATGRTGAR